MSDPISLLSIGRPPSAGYRGTPHKDTSLARGATLRVPPPASAKRVMPPQPTAATMPGMNTPTSIRLDILSAAVRAIAASLPADRANQVEQALRANADELSGRALGPDTDAALAAELSKLLNALNAAQQPTRTQTAGTLRRCA